MVVSLVKVDGHASLALHKLHSTIPLPDYL